MTGQSFVFLAVVTGSLLDERVNHARTDFDIVGGPDEMDDQQSSLFRDDVRRADIRNHVVEFVSAALRDILIRMNEAKLETIEQYVSDEAPHYRILLKRAGEFIDKIPPNPGKGDIEHSLHRELHAREVELKRKGSRILIDADKLENYEDYRERFSEFMSEYNELGVSALAQYVTHRKIILTLFEKALSIDDETGRYPLEKVLHHIIFPMGSTSDDVLLAQQNLWIIDEKLNYHSVITSDKRLDKIDGLNSGSALRPDVLVFNRKYPLGDTDGPLTTLTVVEFKRPMRNEYDELDNPLTQVIEVVNTIREGKLLDEKGRPISVASDTIPTNCYIVCDLTPKLKSLLLDFDATPTPDGQGFYGYHRNSRMYYEVLDYNKVLKDARQRNRALFDRLNLL